MELEYIHEKGHKISVLKSKTVVIKETQDALDLMANSSYNDASKVIIFENQITPEFFDLKTKLAGDILQKFSNYQMQLAIVGDFSKYTSKSLKDFIFESNKFRRINFVGTLDEAKERLGR